MLEKIFKVTKKKIFFLEIFKIYVFLFKAKLDAVKTYMSLRRVPNNIEDRVIRWLVYLNCHIFD
jgi:hypothetical protein